MLSGVLSRYPLKSTGRKHIEREYSYLVDSFFSRGKMEDGVAWIEECHLINVHLHLKPQTLTDYAKYLYLRGNFEAACLVYDRLAIEYPGTDAAKIAYLSSASLQLTKMNRPKEAIYLLQQFITEKKTE
jgi:hypothetical protein